MNTLFVYIMLLCNANILIYGLISILHLKYGLIKTWLIMFGCQLVVISLLWPVLTVVMPVRGVPSLVAYIITTLLLFKDNPLKKFAAMALILMQELVAEALMLPVTFIIVTSDRTKDISQFQNSLEDGLLFRIGYECIVLLLVLLVISIWKRKVSSIRKKRDWAFIAFVAVKFFASMVFSAFFVSIGPTIDRVMWQGFAFFNISSMVLLLIFIYYFRNNMEKETKVIALEKQFTIQQEQFAEFTAYFENARKTRHDIKNNLTVMNSLLGNSKIDELRLYTKHFEEQVSLDDKLNYSESLAIASVVDYKNKIMLEKGIKFTCSENIKNTILDELEMCNMLSSLIDIAIEHNKSTDSDKYIKIQIEETEKSSCLYCEYPFKETAKLEDEIRIVNDRMYAIQKIASRYKGKIDICAKDGNTKMIINLSM